MWSCCFPIFLLSSLAYSVSAQYITTAQQALRAVAANANNKFLKLAEQTHNNKLNLWEEHRNFQDWNARNSRKAHHAVELPERKSVLNGAWSKYKLSASDARKELETNRLLSLTVPKTEPVRKRPEKSGPKGLPEIVPKLEAGRMDQGYKKEVIHGIQNEGKYVGGVMMYTAGGYLHRKELVPGRKEVYPVKKEVFPIKKEALPKRVEPPPGPEVPPRRDEGLSRIMARLGKGYAREGRPRTPRRDKRAFIKEKGSPGNLGLKGLEDRMK
ncbi:hypothetical protein MMC10_010944 [Thelotrema lepadinum]|nr:hypothetical protein [Thelotrema lepadinum]